MCKSKVVFCETCKCWFHCKCKALTQSQFEGYSIRAMNTFVLSVAEVCMAVLIMRPHYNNSPLQLNLLMAIETENVLLRKNVSLKSDLVRERCNVQMDYQSLSILNKCGGIRERTPVEVPGDGDCVFQSLSVRPTLCGNTSLSTELWVLCCIEQMKNASECRQNYVAKLLHLVSPGFKEAGKDIANIHVSMGIPGCCHRHRETYHVSFNPRSHVSKEDYPTIPPPVNRKFNFDS